MKGKHRATSVPGYWRSTKHLWLNRWHFFTKPKIRKTVARWVTQVKEFSLIGEARKGKNK